jgi:ribosomal protein L35AE/L33A
LFKLLETKDDNLVVNVGSSEAVTIKDLAYKIQNVLNISKDVIIKTNNVDHPEKSNFYIPNINKANKHGLIESISLKNSIIKTYDFYKKIYY